MSGSLQAAPDPYSANNQKTTQQSSATSQAATLFVDRSTCIQGISQAAAELLHLDENCPGGQPLHSFADGLLSVLTLHHDRPAPATLVTLEDGRTLEVNTRCVRGRNEQLRGWMLTLHDVGGAVQQPQQQPAAEEPEAQATRPAACACEELRQQVQSMRELVAMLPSFSQRQDWRELLVGHMQQLLDDMSSKLDQRA
jgi:hypothetical protein